MIRHAFCLAIAVAATGIIMPAHAAGEAKAEGDAKMAFTLTSSAFQEGQPIPKKYTGEGQDISPPLQWTDPPADTKSFALICDDPDAPKGTWVHWVAWNIPAQTRSLPEGVPGQKKLESGITQGNNSWPKLGYGGPMPPPGKPHRYYFKLYALDAEVQLEPGATKEVLLNAVKGHTLAEAQLMGTYQR